MLNLAAYIRSPDHSTKGTTSRLDALCVLVGSGFQVLFHSPPGVLFTFPSQYYSLSVTGEYLGLEGGPPGFPQGFSCPVVLWILQRVFWFRLPDFHRLWSAFPKQFDYHSLHRLMQSTTPKNQVLRFGLFPFRSPLLRKSIFLSPPIAT